MKVSFMTAAVLATAISANPIRIITVSGSGPIENLNAFESLPASASEIAQSLSQTDGATEAEAGGKRPCHRHGHFAPLAEHHAQHKGQGSSSFFPGPIGALLSRLGINRGSHEEHHHGWHHSHSHAQSDSAVHSGGQGRPSSLFDALKAHMENVEGNIVPLMEGGMVRILPVMKENSENGFASVEDVQEKQDEHHHRHGHHGHHRHHKAHSFGGRLHRALANLSPIESLGFAFVLGAGLGSILHFFFMIFLLTFRRCHGRSRRDGLTCRQRREARREARRVRKAARAEARQLKKAGAMEGGVKLEGVEDQFIKTDENERYEEVLPSYEEGEADRLVVVKGQDQA